jgi:hypothetical protein
MVYATVENPLWPPFAKGKNAYPPASLDARAVLEPIQVITSSPFDKRGTGGFLNNTHRNKNLTFGLKVILPLNFGAHFTPRLSDIKY